MSETDSRAALEGVKRVLVVDDDVVLLAGLKRMLESQGYAVRTADQGALALEIGVIFNPDLVVLDVMMPHMDGWEVLRRIRARDTSEHVPVIMLTASDADASKVKGFELGADDYVTKPFSVHELRCRIAAVLRRSSTRGPGEEATSIPVVVSGSNIEFLRVDDVYYVEGIRNYTYVHTANTRFLSRLTLGALEERQLPGLMRVHRSFIVNMDHVRRCGWATRSAYHLVLADATGTEIPVGRALVQQVQQELGLRP